MKWHNLFLPILFSFTFVTCDIFQTRDPEPPTQSTSTHEPPVSADAVLRNFRFSLIEHNVVNYVNCFADTSFRQYLFTPSNLSSAFSHWNLESERQYFLNLGTPQVNVLPIVTLSVTDSLIASDSANYTMNYLFYYPHNRTDVSQIVRGNMRFSLGRNTQGFWYLYRWEDYRTTTDSTWSYLKANF